jgi:DNA-binding transcriptional LysR family regulator
VELRHLKYFVAVAEELSFTAAALRLNISQPPLSQQIKDLELEIGTELFQRTSRHVELTGAGITFLEHARAILARSDRAIEHARAVGFGQVGTLDIGTTGSVLLGPLADLIAAFSASTPGVAVRIHEMGPIEQHSALLSHRTQISFIRRPAHQPELITEVAWREKVGVVLPNGHMLARKDKLLLADLKDQNLVFLQLSDSRFARYLRDCCVEAGFAPKISHEVVESYSLTSLVAAGMGIALVPEGVKTMLRHGIVYRPLADPAPAADVEIMYRPDHTALIQKFLLFTHEFLTARSGNFLDL